MSFDNTFYLSQKLSVDVMGTNTHLEARMPHYVRDEDEDTGELGLGELAEGEGIVTMVRQDKTY
ncbi:hypothetical protein AAE478_007214 [Parahypoxylon ruwenzoriense]